ncbi:MAG: YbfB/YjiJ family MFS transporter [Proteobacteria bacterium]|nr:YbfB/YjiJ family MFS transporter [Pseudomonadota bacterium]
MIEKFNFKVLILILTGAAALAIAVGIGRFSYTPILPYMLEELNMSKTNGGLIASWNFFGYLVGSLLSILSIFKQKLKFIFFTAIIFSLFTTLLMSFCENVIFFIIVRFLSGVSSAFVLIFGTSLILPSIQALGKKSLSTAHFMGVGLGMFLSSILVSVLGDFNFIWSDLWIGVTFLAILLAIPVFIFTPDQTTFSSSYKNAKNVSKIGFNLITLSYGLYGFGYVVLGTFISTMARETSGLESTESYVWLLVGLSGMPMVIFWPWIGKKIGIDIALFLACIVMAIGILMPVLIENKLGIIFSAIFLGSTFVPITALALLEGQTRYKGSIRVSTAILTISFSIGQMIGPYFGGIIIDLFLSYDVALYISSISLFIASILVINPNRYNLLKLTNTP